jgi:hypothetical protein
MQSNKKLLKSQKAKGKRADSGLRARVVHPPPWSPNLIIRRKIRFQASAANVAPYNTVTVDNIFGLHGMAINATTMYTLFTSVRIREIEMWGPPASSLAPVTVAVRFPAGVFSGISNPESVVSDTSIGATVPAYLRAKPPKNSLANMWVSGDLNSSMMQLEFPINAIVDFTFDGSISTAFGGPSITPFIFTVVGATTGDMYCLALDSTPSTGLLVPVSLNTLT